MRQAITVWKFPPRRKGNWTKGFQRGIGGAGNGRKRSGGRTVSGRSSVDCIPPVNKSRRNWIHALTLEDVRSPPLAPTTPFALISRNKCFLSPISRKLSTPFPESPSLHFNSRILFHAGTRNKISTIHETGRSISGGQRLQEILSFRHHPGNFNSLIGWSN